MNYSEESTEEEMFEQLGADWRRFAGDSEQVCQERERERRTLRADDPPRSPQQHVEKNNLDNRRNESLPSPYLQQVHRFFESVTTQLRLTSYPPR